MEDLEFDGEAIQCRGGKMMLEPFWKGDDGSRIGDRPEPDCYCECCGKPLFEAFNEVFISIDGEQVCWECYNKILEENEEE